MDNREQIENIVIDVFEKMGFLLGNKAEKKDFIPSSFSGYIRAMIEYKGGKKGRVVIITTKALGKVLAANILGMDQPEAVSEEYQADAIMEFLNVFCGNLITALHGTKMVFNVGVPVLSSPDNEIVSAALTESGSGFLMVESNPFIFILTEK